MFKSIKEFIFGKPVEAPAVESAPYKVPEPVATTPIPLVVEVAPTLVEIIPAGIEATMTAPAKAPRKPRIPKAVSETAVVKKAAPVKKAAAIKAVPKSKKV